MASVNKKICVCACGHEHNINERVISMYTGLVIVLWRVMRWCEEKNIHEFQMRDIRHLLGRNEYARFGDLVLFGGLVYKLEKASYGLHIPRCREFFAGKRAIPRFVLKNPTTREITPMETAFINDMPNLYEFLDENKQYLAMYQEPSQPKIWDRAPDMVSESPQKHGQLQNIL